MDLRRRLQRHRHTVADDYWADFLFGLTSSYQFANYFVVHLRQSLDSAYAQDDWKLLPNLTLNLGAALGVRLALLGVEKQHLELRSCQPGGGHASPRAPWQETASCRSRQRRLRQDAGRSRSPRLVAARRISVRNPAEHIHSRRLRHRLRSLHTRRLGRHHRHQRSAGPVRLSDPAQSEQNKPLLHSRSRCRLFAVGSTTPSCFATSDQGFPSGLVTTFNPATDNITWVPKNTPDSYVESYFLSVQHQLAKNYAPRPGLCGQPWTQAARLSERQPESLTTLGTANVQGDYSNWPSDITEALNEFYSNFNALQSPLRTAIVGGLTLLNSFTWEHSLDNASASLEGNTPSPQNGLNLHADYAQSDYNLPIANVTSLIYDLPFGHGRHFLSSLNGAGEAVLGGWQISAINTAQAGTPFNLTIRSQCHAAGFAANFGNLSRRQRVPARPGVRAKHHPGKIKPGSQYRLRQLH